MEDDKAVSCIDLVRRFTASSISSENFKLSLRLVWFSRVNLNLCPSPFGLEEAELFWFEAGLFWFIEGSKVNS